MLCLPGAPCAEVALSHGDENPITGEPPQARSAGGIQQPDPGPVTEAAAGASPAGPGPRDDPRRRMEGHGPGADGGDDQRGTGIRQRDPGGPAAVLEALRLQLEQQAWSGPSPPSVLAQYEQVQPGLAERIVAMAETAATGEIKTRDRLASAEIEQSRAGQALAFLLTIVALGASIYFFAVHDPVAGGVLVSFPVIMLIRSFLTGLRGEDRGRDDDRG